eukprot:8292017-Pyramimonas_sp.AAC.1
MRVKLKPRRARNRGACARNWALTRPLLYIVIHANLKTRAARNGPNEPAAHYLRSGAWNPALFGAPFLRPSAPFGESIARAP